MSKYLYDMHEFESVDKLTIKCKCGHTQISIRSKTICTWCGKYIFRNEKEEFKYRLNEARKKLEK